VPAPPDADAPGATAVLAVDPGRRIGLAWVDAQGELLRSAVVDVDALAALTVDPGVTVVLGDGTGAPAAQAALARAGIHATLVDETATTEEARRLFWRRHPPRGWRRWLPPGMLVPPRSLDDFAAYAIALRWLGGATSSRRPSR
jgi:hypothetical protein